MEKAIARIEIRTADGKTLVRVIEVSSFDQINLKHAYLDEVYEGVEEAARAQGVVL